MSVLKQLVSTASGNATGVAATAISGNVVFMGDTSQKVTDLSVLVSVTANTSGLTFTPRWQVSTDQTTWYVTKADPDSAFGVLATGASGGGNVTGAQVLPAPSFVRGWRFCRAQVVVGGGTGTTSDLYSLAYSYRQHRSGAQR